MSGMSAYEDHRWKKCSNCGAGLFTNRTTCYFNPHPKDVQPLGDDGQCGGELTEPTDSAQCTVAALGHGPGHQSTTRCDVEGSHDLHHCIYGSYRQEAFWRGAGLTCSGFFDEPPEETP